MQEDERQLGKSKERQLGNRAGQKCYETLSN
jgi:hypothetical protein